MTTDNIFKQKLVPQALPLLHSSAVFKQKFLLNWDKNNSKYEFPQLYMLRWKLCKIEWIMPKIYPK